MFFTKNSLYETTRLLLAVQYQVEKPKWEKCDEIEQLLNVNYKKKDNRVYPVYDPEQGFSPKFTFLKDYYEMYKEESEKEFAKSELLNMDALDSEQFGNHSENGGEQVA